MIRIKVRRVVLFLDSFDKELMNNYSGEDDDDFRYEINEMKRYECLHFFRKELKRQKQKQKTTQFADMQKLIDRKNFADVNLNNPENEEDFSKKLIF